MANRLKFIGQASTTAFGSDLVINVNGIDDPNFICTALRIRHEITLSAVTSGDFSEFNVGQAQHELLWRKTNRPFLNNVSFRALDIWAKAQQEPGVRGYDVLADQAALTTVQVFDQIVPLERKQAARPKDYCVALDEIGTLTVQIPTSGQMTATGNLVGPTLSTWTVRFYALGYDAKPGMYHAGILARIDELTGPSGNDVELKCYGNKVRSLNEFSIDTSGSPITGEDAPRIEYDGRLMYDYRNLDGGDAALYAGQAWGNGDAYSTYIASSAPPQQVTLNAPWVVPDVHQKVSDMKQVNTMQLRYNSRLSDTTDARFVLETIYPDGSGSRLAERVPNAAGIADPEDVTFRPGPTGSADGASQADKAFLPVNVAT